MEAILDPQSQPQPSGLAAGATRTSSLRRAGLRAASVLRILLVLFLLVDAGGKILRLAPYVEGTVKVGYPASCLVPLGGDAPGPVEIVM